MSNPDREIERNRLAKWQKASLRERQCSVSEQLRSVFDKNV